MPEQRILQSLQLRFDELNALVKTLTSDEFFALPKEEAKRKFEECLFWFYVDGYSSGILMLDEDGLITEMPNGYEFMDITYPDGQNVFSKFEQYFDNEDAERMAVLMDSESHRMYNAGSIQSAQDVRAASESIGRPIKVTKKWNTMKDDRVRDMHWTLEGKEIPFDEEFITGDGDYGMAPGQFQTAENNANCRCWLSYKRTNA